MALRRVIEAPSYREASIAAGAERQQYGTDSGANGRGSAPSQRRFRAHEREAHLNHSPPTAAIGASSLDGVVAHLADEESVAGRVGMGPRYGARDATQLSDEERRMIAGLGLGRRAKVAEVARKLKETAMDLPALAGLPPMTNSALEAISKYGKGGGPGGAGRAGGAMDGGGGGGPGQGFDPSYLPESRLGPAGFTVGGRRVTGGGPGDGSGGKGGFAEGFMGSGYVPQGRGGAMDPKSPSGRSLGVGGPTSGGSGAASWDPRRGPSDMFGERYGGRSGLPGTRPDASFRARTWKAFNPGGWAMDDKPKDPPPPPDEKPKEDKPKPKDEKPNSPTPPSASIAPYHTPQTPEDRVIRSSTIGAIVGGVVAAALGRNVAGVVVGVLVGGVGGAGIQALREKSHDKNWQPRWRPADDGNSPTGPRSNSMLPADDGNSPTGPRTSGFRPADEGNSPTGPRSNSLRPADDGNSPTGPRINIRPSDEGGPVGPSLRETRQKPT